MSSNNVGDGVLFEDSFSQTRVVYLYDDVLHRYLAALLLGSTAGNHHDSQSFLACRWIKYEIRSDTVGTRNKKPPTGYIHIYIYIYILK
jgi:hypothetical protein